MATPPHELSPVESAIEAEDPVALAHSTTADEIRRLELAEKVLELKYNRRKRTSKLTNVMSILAFSGLAVNAFQSYTSGQTQERQRERDDQRWQLEFARAKQADKYRAFFETSALATDSANADKRLIGYALLQEFVDDKDYNDKATLMLEEALISELNKDEGPGLSEEHRASVVAIVTALSSTSDCRALGKATKSIDRIAKRRSKSGDTAEAQEVFAVYVRRLVGRAMDICKNPSDVALVDRPIVDTLMKTPDLGGFKGKITEAQAAQRIAEILRDECAAEIKISGATDCPDILRGYWRICAMSISPIQASACDVIKAAVDELPAPPPRTEPPKAP
jgi:hypothetical protein